MTPTITTTIAGIEFGSWSVVTGPSINPVAADFLAPNQLPDSVLFSLYSSKPYGGGLFKQGIGCPVECQSLIEFYDLMVDDATGIYGQVAETDTKFTDAQLYTYPGDFQWNIAAGWVAQIGNPWQNAGYSMAVPPAPGEWVPVEIHRVLDYVKHTISTVGISVRGVYTALTNPVVFPASIQNPPWGPLELVNQKQMCNNAKPGQYNLKYRNMKYTLA